MREITTEFLFGILTGKLTPVYFDFEGKKEMEFYNLVSGGITKYDIKEMSDSNHLIRYLVLDGFLRYQIIEL